MARVLVLGMRPYHLTVEEADAWMQTAAQQLVGVDPIERVALTWLRAGSKHFAAPWDWVLELDLRNGADFAACLDAGVCSELLMDLRLLGMRPEVLLAEGTDTTFWDS